MSGNTNPNVVTDGLVLCLDSYNEQSYLGEPTVNLMTNPTFQNKTAGSSSAWGWGTGYSGTVYYLEDNPPEGDLYFGLYCSTPNVWMEHAQLTNLTASTTYKLSYWIRVIPDSGTYWNTIYVYALTDSAAVLSQGVACGGTWVRHTTQFTTRSTTQNYRVASYNYTAGTTIYISGIQIEEKSHVTKFVSGTRSATDGWQDLSGNDNHADLTQVSYSSTNVPGTNVNNFSFDGTDDYMDCPADVTDNDNGSIEAWFKTSSSNTYNDYLLGHQHAVPDFGIYKAGGSESNGYLKVWVRDTGWTTYNLISDAAIDDGVFHQCVLTWGSGGLKLYVDGVVNDTNSWTGHWGTITNSLAIGSIRSNSGVSTAYAWQGEISKVNIYNSGLSATEVLQNYNAHKERYGL